MNAEELGRWLAGSVIPVMIGLWIYKRSQKKAKEDQQSEKIIKQESIDKI